MMGDQKIVRRNGLWSEDVGGREMRTWDTLDLSGYIPAWFYPDGEPIQDDEAFPANINFWCQGSDTPGPGWHEDVGWRARIRWSVAPGDTKATLKCHPEDERCWLCDRLHPRVVRDLVPYEITNRTIDGFPVEEAEDEVA